jgi:ribosomal peptide maturation radical SAM protein 1
MPFGMIQTPSLALGLLHSIALAVGNSCRTLNLNLAFAAHVGLEEYARIADGEPARMDLLGEWIFSSGVFSRNEASDAEYIHQVFEGFAQEHRTKRGYQLSLAQVLEGSLEGGARDTWLEQHAASVADILRIRRATAAYLDFCVDAVLSHDPAVVGITSIFQEHTAALSLARRLKAHRPSLVIVLGGSNCEGAMGAETARQFPFLDAVVSGEGEEAFRKILIAARERRSFSGIPGVLTRRTFPVQGNCSTLATPTVRNLDDLPLPNYDDYFSQVAELPVDVRDLIYVQYPLHLILETSRGCWWGEKHHCTFCGLNGATMEFRSKSAGRALYEIDSMVQKHPGCAVHLSDNILDYRYFDTLLPQLAMRATRPQLFYEVKSNLRKEHVRLLKNAGVVRIQPGIESLSDEVLTLMRKGVTGLQNIQLLKWCEEFGIRPDWGILWGFPGESPDEYERVANMLPLLAHLFPPMGATTIRLDRFSPNFEEAEKRGISQVQPFPAARFVYPLDEPIVANLSYFFSYQHADGRDVDGYTKKLSLAVAEWKATHDTSALFSVEQDDAMLICDLRGCATRALGIVRGLERDIIHACDRVRTRMELERLLGATDRRISEALRELESDRWVIRDENRYLSLVIPLGDYSPSDIASAKFLELIQGIGERVGNEYVLSRELLARKSLNHEETENEQEG